MLGIGLRSAKNFGLAGITILVALALGLCEPRVGRLWLNTAWLAIAANLIAMPLGTLAAILLVKTDFPGRGVATALLAGMLLVPLFLFTGAWDAGFGIQGWYTLSTNPHLAHAPLLSGWRAAVWVHGLAAVPWVALIVAAGLRSVETELEEEASLVTTNLGVLWHVTFRRAAPAAAVAAVWVAIVVSIEISVTDFFQVRTFAEEVYTQGVLGAFNSVDGVPADESARSTANASAVGNASQSTSERDSPPFTAAGLWIGLLLSTLLAVVALVVARGWISEMGQPSLRQRWLWRMGASRWGAAAFLSCTLLVVAGVPLGNMLYKAGLEVTQAEGVRMRSWSAMQVLRRVSKRARSLPGGF